MELQLQLHGPGDAIYTGTFVPLVRRHLRLLDGERELSLDADLESLGLDSVAALSLMLDLEDTFGVVFSPSMFTEDTFATPQALWGALLSLKGQGRA